MKENIKLVKCAMHSAKNTRDSSATDPNLQDVNEMELQEFIRHDDLFSAKTF